MRLDYMLQMYWDVTIASLLFAGDNVDHDIITLDGYLPWDGHGDCHYTREAS